MATRWGIVSVGSISTDFVLALGTLPQSEHKTVAVAARDLARAQSFADEHGIKKAYGSYEELAADSEVDVVYIGTINPEHLRVGKMFLEAGKPVLCEKPLCMNRKEVEELQKVAKDKNLFLMEAVWSRCHPLYKRLREEINKGTLGDPLIAQIEFGVPIANKDRVRLRDLGGSTVLDIGIYCIQLALFIFGHPTAIKAIGTKNDEGVDESAHILLEFPDGKAALLTTTSKLKLENDAKISGTGGTAILRGPFWTPTELILNGETINLVLPESPKPFRHQNSAALRYEAEETRRCLLAGLKESPAVTWDESIAIVSVLDEVRKQLGVVFDQD